MFVFSKKLIAIMLMALVALSTSIKAQDKRDYKARLGDIDQQIEAALRDFNVPGMAIAIVADGQVIKTSGYGLRDAEQRLPVTPDTQFSIGSATKAFTSLVIGSLVDEGKLDWYTPVKQVLPEWYTADPYLTEHGTVVDLLSHRTGLARHELIWLANPHLTSEDLLDALPHLEMSSTYREGFIYNNLMYAVAGIIAQQVSEKSWSQLLQNRVLNPLNMRKTTLELHHMLNSGDFAQPYIDRADGFENIDFNKTLSEVMKPAGAMNSTANDMAKWLRLLLNRGEYQHGQLIKKRTLATLQSPHTVISPYVGESGRLPMHYALGWFTKTYRGYYQVQHGGNIEGFTTAVFTYPSEGVGIVVMANKHATRLPHALSLMLSDRLLGLKPGNHIERLRSQKQADATTFGERQSPKAEGQQQGAAELGQYAGEFFHPGYGKMTISAVDGKLVLKYKLITEEFSLDKADRFISHNTQQLGLFEDELLIYERDESGAITAVMVPFDFPKPIRFTRARELKICFFLCTEDDFN